MSDVSDNDAHQSFFMAGQTFRLSNAPMNESRFTQQRGAFAMTCAVEVNIRASTRVIWGLLTDAAGVPRWNSTVTDAIEERRMVWSDGVAPLFRGVRTFVLEPHGESTRFRMEERFSGFIFGLVKRMMPDFGPIFQAYANDLKRAAENA